MNNNTIIARLKEAGRNPRPERKDEFFKALAQQGLLRRQPVVMSHGEFLLGQICYIERWIWVASGLLLLFIVWLSSRNPGYYPFALTPLLAAGVLVETERSQRFGMAELEYAARFSLRSIVFARMFLVGLMDTAGLMIVVAAVGPHFPYSLFRVFLYMMVPYLTASFLGSVYERKMRTDAGFGSLVICILSSAVFAAAPFFFSQLYEAGLTAVWAAAFVLLTAGLGASVRDHMHEMEEPVWS